MKIHDISWTISKKMSVYKNKREKRPDIVTTNTNYVQESTLILDSHTGTHVDAPRHMLKGGSGVDAIALSKLQGQCKVLNLTKVKNKISAKDLSGLNVCEADIILLKTTNSKKSETAKFDINFVYLDKSAAKYLKQKKVKAVGIDYLGIERSQKAHKTHKTLLLANIPIIEGLRLQNIQPGPYEFVCLPIKIKNCDAAPARAILIDHYK